MTVLYLSYGRLGRTPALCCGCGKTIAPQQMMIQRSDGSIFCTDGCEEAHPSPAAPTRRVIT